MPRFVNHVRLERDSETDVITISDRLSQMQDEDFEKGMRKKWITFLVSGHGLTCQQKISLFLAKTLPIYYEMLDG